MARVTVEDCLDRVENHFELVLIASKRARQIAQGGTPFVEELNDKPTVIALREIAEGFIDSSFLESSDEVRFDEIGGELMESEQEPEEQVFEPFAFKTGFQESSE